VRVAPSLASVSARPSKLTIPAAESGTVALTFTPRRAGAYRGVVRLMTDDPSAPSVTVAVRGTASYSIGVSGRMPHSAHEP
jgi:hypothetical protein